MELTEILPHDLLTFANADDFITENPLPDWAKDSLRQARIAVVRRGEIKNDLIPVGLRGYERNQRLAGFINKSKIIKQYHPWYFIEHQSWRKLPIERQNLPAFQALKKVTPLLKDYQWGISGSLAYEMATGVVMVKNSPAHSSDLDIIMTDKVKLSRQKASDLLKKLNQFGTHADVQIIHGQNGFALEEYAQNRDAQIMIKTATGPTLAKDPWEAIR